MLCIFCFHCHWNVFFFVDIRGGGEGYKRGGGIELGLSDFDLRGLL